MDERDAKSRKLQWEIAQVAERLHQIAKADPKLAQASLVGVTGGALLLAVVTGRFANLNDKAIDELLAAVRADFVTVLTPEPERFKRVADLFAQGKGTEAINALREVLGVARARAKRDEELKKKVGEVDAVADRIIAAAAEAVDNERKDS